MAEQEEIKQVLAEVAQTGFDTGWNAAVIAIAQSIENMKVFGDTAASFAIYVKEFHRD
jgi:uncharacterized protein (UPF0335 family)